MCVHRFKGIIEEAAWKVDNQIRDQSTAKAVPVLVCWKFDKLVAEWYVSQHLLMLGKEMVSLLFMYELRHTLVNRKAGVAGI